MPWTTADVDKHSKGLTDKQKRAWVAVANRVLNDCIEAGGSDKTCAPKAIRQANAAAKRVTDEAITRWSTDPTYSERQEMTDAQRVDAYAVSEVITMRAHVHRLIRQIDNLREHDDTLSNITPSPLSPLRVALLSRWGPPPPVNSATESAARSETSAIAAQSAQEAVEAVYQEAEEILRQDDSFDALRQRIYHALLVYVRATATDMYGEIGWPWIRDMFTDAVVFEWQGKCWRADYTVDVDGTVTLGDVSEVQVAYVPARTNDTVEERESVDDTAGRELLTAELVPLSEAGVVATDGTVRVKIIAPGWGSSGYYSREMLKRDGPRIFTAGTHSFWNHPTDTEYRDRPEGDLHQLAGVQVSDAEYVEEDARDGEGLYANLRVFSPYRDVLDEVAEHIGLSIRAWGKGKNGKAEGREGRIITELTDAASVDFVTRAGAGGKVASLVEAARKGATQTHEQHTQPANQSTEGKSVTPEEAQALQETATRAQEAAAAAQEAIRAAEARAARLEESMILRDASDFVRGELARMPNLHDMTRERLLAALVPQAPIIEKDGMRVLDRAAYTDVVKEAIAHELDYIAKTTGVGSGAVRGMGEPTASRTELDEAGVASEMAMVAKRLGLNESEAKRFAAGVL